jgi:hypothetical protein
LPASVRAGCIGQNSEPKVAGRYRFNLKGIRCLVRHPRLRAAAFCLVAKAARRPARMSRWAAMGLYLPEAMEGPRLRAPGLVWPEAIERSLSASVRRLRGRVVWGLATGAGGQAAGGCRWPRC